MNGGTLLRAFVRGDDSVEAEAGAIFVAEFMARVIALCEGLASKV